VPHFVERFAIRVASASGGGSLAYSADSSPSEGLIDLSEGCDLLLVEATLPRPERTGPRGHMTPEEAGEHARVAGARRVVLTHISDELDIPWARAQASKAFGDGAEVAREGAVYEI